MDVFYSAQGRLWRKRLGADPVILPFGESQDVIFVSVNSRQTLLAVVGVHDLVVYDIDARYEVMRLPEKVRHCAWHPLAYDDAALAILTESGRLELVDIAAAAANRTRVVERLLPPPDMAADTSVELDAGVYDPIHFCFGAGALSIIVTSSDGDLYLLSPVLPPRIEVEQSQLSEILDSIIIGQQNDSSAVAFASELARAVETAPEFTWAHGTRLIVVDRPAPPSPLPQIPAVQGPLRLSPYPTELYSEESQQIASCPLTADGFLHLVAHTTTSRLNIYIGAGLAPLAWESPEEPPALALVSSITIPGNDRSDTGTKRIETVGPEVIIMSTLSATYIVDIRQVVEKALQGETGATADVHSIGPSLVFPPATTDTAGTIKQWDSTDDDLVSGMEDLAVAALPPSHPYVDTSRLAKARHDVEALTTAPQFELPALLSADIQSLEALDKLAQHYESRLAVLYKALLTLAIHREAQRREMRLQTSRVDDVRKSLDRLASGSGLLQRAIDASKRQQKLDERTAQLSAAVSKLRERGAPIGSEERRWFDELQRLSSRLSAEGPIATRLNALKTAVPDLQAPAQAPSVVLSADQQALVREMRRRLAQQEQQFADLNSQLATLTPYGA